MMKKLLVILGLIVLTACAKQPISFYSVEYTMFSDSIVSVNVYRFNCDTIPEELLSEISKE